MDIFEYRTTRSITTEGVFVVVNINTEVGGLFMRLENLMISEIHLLWDIAFLEQYSKERMVPRGLRWDVHPQQDDTEVQAWFHYFNEVGISFLGFLVDKKRSKISQIDREIKDLKEKLLPHKTTSEYISLSANLKNQLEKEEREQRTKKQKKYTRDISDYRNNLVFTWQKKDSNPSAEVPGQMGMDTSPPDPSTGEALTAPPLNTTRTDVRNKDYPKTPRNLNRPNAQDQIPNHPPKNNNQYPHRGRGGTRRGRGSSRGRNENYKHSGPSTRDRSPRHDYYARNYPEQQYSYRTPVRTYNRFSPLREEPYGNHYNTQRSHRENEYTQYDRSPYTYNNSYPNPPHPEDFPRGSPGPKRRASTNEAPEGDGGPGKRRRY